MKIIECPRDAWQGRPDFIATHQKAAYINRLLQVGFHTIDVGSFVSPKAMPQVSDTAQLLRKLDLTDTATSLLTIVANERGALQACEFDEVTYLGYPFSLSETFQFRNTNSTISDSLKQVEVIQNECSRRNKKLVIYVSMGFGNPYGDLWNAEIVVNYVNQLAGLGVEIFSLSDTVGLAKPADVTQIFEELTTTFSDLEFGGHFHTHPTKWREKVEAAYVAGCRRFDGALLGFGGCPMAQDDLVGNMPTERLVEFLMEKQEPITIDLDVLEECSQLFRSIVK